MQPFNLEQFAAQARAMQDHVAQMQSRLESASVTEEAGGGLVTVSLGAQGRVQNVSIDPSLLDPSKRELLENLVAEAFTNASSSMHQLAEEHMRPVSDTISHLTGLGNAGLDRIRKM